MLFAASPTQAQTKMFKCVIDGRTVQHQVLTPA